MIQFLVVLSANTFFFFNHIWSVFGLMRLIFAPIFGPEHWYRSVLIIVHLGSAFNTVDWIFLIVYVSNHSCGVWGSLLCSIYMSFTCHWTYNITFHCYEHDTINIYGIVNDLLMISWIKKASWTCSSWCFFFFIQLLFLNSCLNLFHLVMCDMIMDVISLLLFFKSLG